MCMKLGKITYSSIRLSEYVKDYMKWVYLLQACSFVITGVILKRYNIYMMSFSRVYFDFERSCETLMYVARSCLFMYNITENGGKTPWMIFRIEGLSGCCYSSSG
jgi:hypothetical protein